MDTRYSKLRNLRVNNKMSQRAFAEIIGTSANMYQKYEYGQIELPVRHAKRLGESFNFDWWILYED